MFDLESWSNGAGIVLLCFIVGYVIRVSVVTIREGTSHKFLTVAALFFLISHSEAFAGTASGPIDSILETPTELYIVCSNETLLVPSGSSQFVYDIYFERASAEFNFNDLDNSITSIVMSDSQTISDKTASLLIGAISSLAFVFGVTLRV